MSWSDRSNVGLEDQFHPLAATVGVHGYDSANPSEYTKEPQDAVLRSRPPLASTWLARNIPGMKWTMRFTGWRMGLTICSSTVLVALLVNLWLTVWAIIYARDRDHSGIFTLVDGRCTDIRTWGAWVHVGINVISTILLGASSYTMQCLASPTRSEIDHAHSRGDWLEIGILSTRNLSRISRERACLWLILAISSVPLHLLFNSTVFEVPSANDYSVAAVTEDFTKGGWFEDRGREPLELKSSSPVTVWAEAEDNVPQQFPFEDLHRNISQLETLEISACIEAYQNPVLSGRRNLFVISSNDTVPHTECHHFNQTECSYRYWNDTSVLPFVIAACAANKSLIIYDDALCSNGSVIYTNTTVNCVTNINPNCTSFNIHRNNSLIDFTYVTIDESLTASGGPTAWMCAFLPMYWNHTTMPSCVGSKAIEYASNWSVMGQPIEYCLSELAPEHCQLQFSAIFMSIVLLCNLVKVLAMSLTLRQLGEDSIMTIGDAAASFLEEEDMTTLGLRMIPKDYIPTRLWSQGRNDIRKWHLPPRRWWSASSPRRWLTCVLFLVSTLITTGLLLQRGKTQIHLNGLSTDIRSLWTMGFGAVRNDALIRLNGTDPYRNGVLSVILLANSPQAVISGLYFIYNGLYTCMVSNDEWVRYGLKRRPLRVSTPRGQQRSSYFLQLPYRFGVPLLLGSALLHWLVSQSIFLARIRVFDMFGIEKPDNGITTVGFSCIAITFVLALCCIMIVCCVAASCCIYSSGAPFISSNSLMISAACHPPKDDVGAAYLPLQWGVISKDELIRYCCLTSQVVQAAGRTGTFVLHKDLAHIKPASEAKVTYSTEAEELDLEPASPASPEDNITRSSAFLEENYGSTTYRPVRYIPIRQQPPT